MLKQIHEAQTINYAKENFAVDFKSVTNFNVKNVSEQPLQQMELKWKKHARAVSL